MAPDDHSGARPAGPVVLRIKLRYDDLDAMVQRFASNVGKSGLFLPTKSVQPIGTEVKFELRLANDVPVLVGLGRVKHVKPFDAARPKAAFGMSIELMRVSREGREVIIRMIERRRAMGLPDVAIPVPEDAEAARRNEVETQPRAESSGIVREAMAPIPSMPVHEQVLTAPRPASGPIAIARDERSGRISVPVLAPEPSRPRRPHVQELINKATELSARIQVVEAPELDMQVDLEKVLTRARALAGGDLEGELAVIREAAATPIEISVEAASAELARALGGKAIGKREKSARWEPPPPVETRTETSAPEFVAKTRAETELAPSAAIAAVVDSAISLRTASAVVRAPAEPGLAEAQPPVDASALVEAEVPVRADSPSIVPEEAYVMRHSAPLETAAYQDGGDYVDQQTPLPSEDYVESFPAATAPTPRTDPSEIDPATEPPQKGLMIDDDADISSFERALDAARIHTGVSTQPAPERPGDRELDDLTSDPSILLASGEYQAIDENELAGENTQIGAAIPERFGQAYPDMSEQLAQQLDRQLEEHERETVAGMGEDEEEISDLDVLAEADDDDADLMSAQAEQPRPHEYGEPQQEDDFASRLDLGDDDVPPSEALDRNEAREFDRSISEGEFPAEDPPSSSYTFAEDYPQAALHPHEGGGEDFDEPHNYTAQPPAPVHRGPDPRVVKHGRATTEDLEDALAALDVDLDDIALEQRRARVRRPTPSGQRPLPGLPMERPRTGPVPVVAPAPATPPKGVAHTVRRNASTGGRAAAKPPTMPPPIPAAARNKPPTQQQPVVRQQPKRAPTDEGVLIDFDDDE